MEILNVNCFALKSNGTLLIKTEMVDYDDSYRYSFYIYKGAKAVFKSAYSAKSFLVYQADQLGDYKIKAFVRNADGSEKVSLTVPYTLSSRNAPLLAANTVPPPVSISVQHIRDRFYSLSIIGELPSQAQFAWYIYHVGTNGPLFRGTYSAKEAMLYEFAEPGTYYAKLFIKQGNDKFTVKSEFITV